VDVRFTHRALPAEISLIDAGGSDAGLSAGFDERGDRVGGDGWSARVSSVVTMLKLEAVAHTGRPVAVSGI
jgi:hypothetical protein